MSASHTVNATASALLQPASAASAAALPAVSEIHERVMANPALSRRCPPPQDWTEVGERGDEDLSEPADHERLQHCSVVGLSDVRDGQGAGHRDPPGEPGSHLQDPGPGPQHAFAGVDRQHRCDCHEPEGVRAQSSNHDGRPRHEMTHRGHRCRHREHGERHAHVGRRGAGRHLGAHLGRSEERQRGGDDQADEPEHVEGQVHVSQFDCVRPCTVGAEQQPDRHADGARHDGGHVGLDGRTESWGDRLTSDADEDQSETEHRDDHRHAARDEQP